MLRRMELENLFQRKISTLTPFDRYEYLLKHILLGSGKCLDVGGGGVEKVKEFIIKKGFEYTSIDERYCNGTLHGNAEQLPFNDFSFDIIIMSCVIGYVKDWKKGIAESCRVLKSGGLFYLYDSFWHLTENSTPIPKEAQQWLLEFPTKEIRGYLRTLSVEECTQELEKNSVTVVRLSIRYDHKDAILIARKL